MPGQDHLGADVGNCPPAAEAPVDRSSKNLLVIKAAQGTLTDQSTLPGSGSNPPGYFQPNLP